MFLRRYKQHTSEFQTFVMKPRRNCLLRGNQDCLQRFPKTKQFICECACSCVQSCGMSPLLAAGAWWFHRRACLLVSSNMQWSYFLRNFTLQSFIFISIVVTFLHSSYLHCYFYHIKTWSTFVIINITPLTLNKYLVNICVNIWFKPVPINRLIKLFTNHLCNV